MSSQQYILKEVALTSVESRMSLHRKDTTDTRTFEDHNGEYQRVVLGRRTEYWLVPQEMYGMTHAHIHFYAKDDQHAIESLQHVVMIWPRYSWGDLERPKLPGRVVLKPEITEPPSNPYRDIPSFGRF